ncbi:MAG: hypothetical protein HQ518_27990 [Rhodopirellula sp.]|nr:hypothetical protein [Rhodopirellula sp.]
MKQDNPDSTPQAPNTASSGSTLLRVALVSGLLWYSLLVWMIATPVSVNVNVRQIAESDAVVRATVDVDGKIHVDHVWRGNVANGPLDVAFPEGVAKPGEFFIPLRRNATGWEITPARIGTGVRLVYPASEAVVSRMRELLDE